MRILAIDPGERNSGYAVLDFVDSGFQVVESGHYSFPGKVTLIPSFVIGEWHRDKMHNFIRRFQPKVVALEFPALNGHRLFSIGVVQFAYMVEAVSRRIDFMHMPSQTWKAWLTGSGKAKKPEYRDKVNKLPFVSKIIGSYDEAAAIAIGVASFRFWLMVYYRNKNLPFLVTPAEERLFFTRKAALVHRRGFLWEFYSERKT